MDDRPRILAFDSLRGLAAVTVVIAHVCGVLLRGHTIDEYTPLYLIRAAHESVIFFFLLSGFVLTYQIDRQGYFNYTKFLLQRFFRIYIPYVVIMVLILISFTAFEVGNPITLEMVVDHLLLIGNFNSDYWNPVIWSLVHEVRVSLVFPILLLVISFQWKNAVSIAVILSMIAAFAITFGVDDSKYYNNSYTYTVHYFSIFVIGGLIAKHSTELIAWNLRLSREIRLTVLVCSLFMFNYSRMLHLIPHKFKFYKIALFNEFVADWVTTISAAVFMITAINMLNRRNFLLHPFPLILGEISYSLYLIHFPVILIGLDLFPHSNKVVVVIISVMVGINLSYFSSRYVERYSRFLGRWVANMNPFMRSGNF